MNIKVKNVDMFDRKKHYFKDMSLKKILERYYLLQEKDLNHDELFSICVQMECETYTDYFFAGKIAKSLGLERVVDIGCAYGHQSDVVLQQGVKYLGVNKEPLDFFNAGDADYLTGHYPLPLPSSGKDLGVAFMSLFWNCYLFESDTLSKQIEAVSKDFKYLLTRMPKDKLEEVAKAFTCYEVFGDLILFRK